MGAAPPSALPPWVNTLLAMGWLTGLLVPVGFWSRRHWGTPLGWTASVGAILFVPAFTAATPTPAHQLFGAVAGIIIGVGLREFVQYRVGGRATTD